MSVMSASLIVAAVRSDGFHASNVDLDDGSVWVVNAGRDWVSRANAQTAEIESAFRRPGAELHQSGSSVYTLSAEGLSRFDATNGLGTEPKPLVPGMQIGVGGDIGFLLDPTSGKVWVYPALGLINWETDSEPTLEVSPGSRAIATETGVVIVVDPETDESIEIDLLPDGSVLEGTPVPIAVDLSGDFSVTSVGDRAVALTGSTLVVLGDDVAAPTEITGLGDELVLQHPSEGGRAVLVAGAEGLGEIALDDGSLTMLYRGGTGSATAPVRLGACVSAAWSGMPRFFQQCAGRADVEQPVPDLAPGTPLRFRVNGAALALSSPTDLQWIVDDGRLVLIENWAQADPDRSDDDEESEEQVLAEVEDEAERTCQLGDLPPVDRGSNPTFGAKVGEAVVIDVISGYDDPNCDPLAVTAASPQQGDPSAVSIINFGQSIQYRATSTGPVRIDLVISDGTNELRSSVQVVVGSDSIRPPVQRNPNRNPKTVVQQGKTVSYNVLIDWIDPDGDPLVLEQASLPEVDGRIVYGSDGLITYTAEDTVIGVKQVLYTLTDGFGHTAAGTLDIVVQPATTKVRPIARDDYATGRVGEPVRVLPLLNDTDANNDALLAAPQLASIPETLQVDASATDGSFVLTATAPGTYIVRYAVTDTSNKSATAAVRFDVIPDDTANRPPVAVRDAAVVREGRTANIDVLANDADPDGDVLAVVEAYLDPSIADSGVARVVVIERRYVRVEVLRQPDAPIRITYLISDGQSQNVDGDLTVSVPVVQGNQYPIVSPDRAVVRVNEVVSVNVLANDRDPDGDQLFFIPEPDGEPAVRLESGQPGVVWLDGATVRYKAGSTPSGTKPIVVTYRVDDDPALAGLHVVSGTLLIDVRSDDEDNLPPVPQPLELRVFTGAIATVRVPLSGIDGNGDTVVLRQDLATQSALGTASVIGTDSIRFDAGPVAGPAEFTYLVEDRFGLVGIGLVRVVVVEGTPHPPVPIDDRLRVRPGRDLQVNVLANDSDPDGDPLVLVGDVIVSDPAVVASLNADGQRVDVQVPAQPGAYSVRYQVTDEKGDPASANIVINADETAPLLAPIVRDDPSETTVDAVREAIRPDGTTVRLSEIAVTANDDDPDGSRLDLEVAFAPGQDLDDGSALLDLPPLPRGSLRAVRIARPQWLVYTATDPDGNVGAGVMYVPAEINQSPVCPAEPLEVIAGGGPLTVDIPSLVTDPDPGDTVQMSGKDLVLTPADGVALQSEGNYTTFTYEANPLTTLSSVLVSVEVNDRPGQPENEVVTCDITILISKINTPPIVTDASFRVEETNVRTDGLSLTQFVTDPDGDPLVFGSPTPSSQSGITFVLTEAGGVQFETDRATPGASVVFTYTVTDGQPTSTLQTGTIRVDVVPTSAPMPSVQSFSFVDVPQGLPTRQNLLDGSFNPFADTPLVIDVDSSPVEGRGLVEQVGNEVVFTPSVDFFGRAVVRFTATDEVGREATGTLTYTVIGKPLVPGQPTVEEVSSRRAVLSWSPADPQGAPITEYVVRWPGGELRTTGATSATIDTLTNGVSVQFTVSAVNKVGEGPQSAASAAVMPDEVPQRPLAPVIDAAFGNGTLTVRWEEPPVDGTPIIEYQLFINSGGPAEILPAAAREFTWTGLVNGTPYSFAIVARNSAGPSERSEFSGSLSPATVPDVPANVVATDAGSAIEARVQLTWSRPADNGRPITGYNIYDNGTLITTFQNNPATTQSFPLTPGNHSFRVEAINVVGVSGQSATSTQQTFARAPASPTLSAVTSDQDRQVTLTYTPPADTGGCALVRHEYELDNSGTWVTLASSRVISGLVNGTTYSVRLRAVNCKTAVPSAPSTARTGKPSGPPIGANIQVAASASGTSINWSWNATGANNGSPLTYSVTGTFTSGAGSGTNTTNHGYSEYHSITVRVCDAIGRCDQRTAGATTVAPPPPPTVSIGLGGASSGACVYGDAFATGDFQGCYNISISMSNFSGAQTVRCYSSTNAGVWSQFASFTAGNGNHQACSYSSAGRWVVVIVGGTTSSGSPQAPSTSGYASNVYGQWPTN